MEDNPKILVISRYYLPGYKAGGPIRTLSNLVERLGDKFSFLVLTGDRDLGDTSPYPDIQFGEWNRVGKALVWYLDPARVSFISFSKKLREFDYDILYLNGFFNLFTRRILIYSKLGLLPERPTILAPRGEFSRGALGIKGAKKNLYLKLVKVLDLVGQVSWQASSEFEKEDIQEVFPALKKKKSIWIAPNVPPTINSERNLKLTKNPGSIKMIFLSRIDPMKNLIFALETLNEINGTVHYDIYGPLEDQNYWKECKRIIEKLPPNITVSYKGMISHQQVFSTFSKYHLFFFPTRGENFGHVIIESLSSGCPVLISDQTPWKDLAEAQAGYSIPLKRREEFRAVIEKFVEMDDDEFQKWSEGAIEFGKSFLHDPAVLEQNQKLFQDLLERMDKKISE